MFVSSTCRLLFLLLATLLMCKTIFDQNWANTKRKKAKEILNKYNIFAEFIAELFSICCNFHVFPFILDHFTQILPCSLSYSIKNSLLNLYAWEWWIFYEHIYACIRCSECDVKWRGKPKESSCTLYLYIIFQNDAHRIRNTRKIVHFYFVPFWYFSVHSFPSLYNLHMYVEKWNGIVQYKLYNNFHNICWWCCGG